jgi:uncharacterized protein (TIGR00288 family)
MTDIATGRANIALLIDFDNIAIGSEENLGTRFDFGKVMESIRERGRIIIKRAYADWKGWSKYQNDMINNAVDMVHLPQHGGSNKNMADIRMTVDALEIVYRNSLIDTFILLTGDSDFSHLVSRLRENGKYVLTIGVRAATSDLLIFNSDEFISYDSIIQPTKIKDVDEGCRLLVDVLESCSHAGPTRISGVKDLMLQKDPSFNEKDFGYRQFKDFILEAENRGYISIDGSRGPELYLDVAGGRPGGKPGGRTATAAEKAAGGSPGNAVKKTGATARDKGARTAPKKSARKSAAGGKRPSRSTAKGRGKGKGKGK